MAKRERRNSHRSAAENGRSGRGMIHGGVRWKTVRRSTTGWIWGTNWTAEAPVPITATRSAGQVVVVVPAGRVEHGAAEPVQAVDGRRRPGC